MGEDTRLNVWRLPELSSSGTSMVRLQHSSETEEQLFTGVQFGPEGCVAVAAYDIPVLHVWPIA